MRSDFVSVGEQELFSEDFAGDLFAWNIDQPEQYSQVKGEGKSYLRFLAGGGVSLKNSLLSDFRMAFEVRLEAPMQAEFAFAMINFRNYFNRRYCLVIEPTVTSLKVARIDHSRLEEIASTRSSHALNRWYKYEIVAVGNSFRVFKNDILILDVRDEGPGIERGNIWFESHSRYSFTNVRVFTLQDFIKTDRNGQEMPPPKIALPPEERISVAVADFDSHGLAPYDASLLCDLYSSSLLSTGVFRVVERKELRKILAEQELQLSDLTGDESAVRIGRILNARYLSTGSIGRIGEQYAVSLKLIDIESGETMASASSSFRSMVEIPESFRSLAEEMAERIVRER
jgi:TolB-like protein